MTEVLRRTKPASEMVLIENLPFATDDGIASRARIGLIVLATDFTIEHEWRKIMSGLDGVALYESRILNDNQIIPETLRAMEPRIASSADVILPGSTLDVVAYGCTSVSMAIGEEKVFERIRSVRPMPNAPHPSLPYLSPVPRCASPKLQRRSKPKPGFTSLHQITPWPGMRCAWPVWTTRCRNGDGCSLCPRHDHPCRSDPRACPMEPHHPQG